jgi:excisionase family DNA binding protein
VPGRLKRPASRRAPPSEPPSEADELEPLLYDVATVCRVLSISKPTLYRRIQAGKISPVKDGRRTRFTAEELQRYVKSLEQKT